MVIGTSYSERRAAYLGLDPRDTFRRLLGMGFGLVRTSAYWDEIHAGGYDRLDWLMDQATAASQPVLLTVGMKGIHWPEFHLPPALTPACGADGCVRGDAGLREEVVGFVQATVARYSDRPNLVAWQIENEPFNRSGPDRWWIEPDLLKAEVAAVRALDGRRVVVNAFAHFDLLQDLLDRPHTSLLDLAGISPERSALEALGERDVLGLDVYTRMGVGVMGRVQIVRRSAADWAAVAGRWREAARQAGRDAWIIESQAEPWEPSRDTYANPRSFQPGMTLDIYEGLAAAGFEVILLWGVEYCLWRADEGDGRWLDSLRRVQASAWRGRPGGASLPPGRR